MPRGVNGLRAAYIFLIKDQSEDRKDQVKWTWKGEMTSLLEFGDPVNTATYVVCVYDGSGNPQPLMSRAAPAGGICNEKPCCSRSRRASNTTTSSSPPTA